MELRFCPILQVQLLSLLWVSELKGTRSLPTPGLCQLRTLSGQVTEAPCPCKCKLKGTSLALGILQLYLNGASARQQPHPCGRIVSSTSSIYFLARTAGVNHSHERKKERRQYHGVHPKNPITFDF